jgi:drug/metabolite transporter (DMT)-like permease
LRRPVILIAAAGGVGLGCLADYLPFWLFALLLTLVYYAFSIGIIFFNNYILNNLFPYPATLTMFHMTFGTVAAAGLIFGARVSSPPTGITASFYFTRIIPLGAFYAVNLWASNDSYLYLDVGFIQMLRPLSGIAIYVMLLCAGKEPPSLKRALTLIVIVGGITVAGVGTKELNNFSWVGVGLVIGGALCYACYMVRPRPGISAQAMFSMIMIMGHLVQVGSQLVMQDSGVKLDPITQLFIIGPAATLALLIVAAFEWSDPDFTFSKFPW